MAFSHLIDCYVTMRGVTIVCVEHFSIEFMERRRKRKKNSPKQMKMKMISVIFVVWCSKAAEVNAVIN